MDGSEQAKLEWLRAQITRSHAATVAWRAVLIESLGNRLCGSGSGPSADEIDILSTLEKAEQQASEDYQRFLVSLTCQPGRSP